MLRRLFAFLFRHDYQVYGASLSAGNPISHMRCTRCGKETSFPTLNRAEFAAMYWERGSTGVTAALSGRGAAKAAAPERKTVHSLDVDDRGFLQRAARHLAAALEVDDADGAEACVINICEVLSTKPVTIRKMDLGDNLGRGAAKGGGG